MNWDAINYPRADEVLPTLGLSFTTAIRMPPDDPLDGECNERELSA